MLNINKLNKNKFNKNLVIRSGDVTNEIKFYPSINEWTNTVFFFNKNNEKSLPSIDISVFSVIKKYFNMFSKNLERSALIRKKPIWKRKLRLNKIFIAKPEFKHTNDKVVITLYMYNRQISILKYRLKKLKKLLYSQFFYKVIVKNALTTKKINIIKTLLDKIYPLKKRVKNLKAIVKKFSVKFLANKYIKSRKRKFITTRNKYKSLLKELLLLRIKINKVKRAINIGKKKTRVIKSISRVLNKINIPNRKKNFIKKSSTIFISMLTYLNINNKINYLFNSEINKALNFKVSNLIYLRLLKKFLSRMRLFVRTNRIIKFNKFKFNILLQPLRFFLENIYKKNVEFNIVTLKSFYLNSSILTQIISSKLKTRNRKNTLLKVIKGVLSKIKVPFTRKLNYVNEVTRIKYIQNLILRQYINKNFLDLEYDMSSNSFNKYLNEKKGNVNVNGIRYIINNSDKLDNILTFFYPMESNISSNNTMLLKRNLKNTVLDTINNKTITGIRIEASGRLTKRISAARAIFKKKQKGTIKNINSSYRKISSVLLRGHYKSNLQFSKANNKTRIGSYGIKGWVSSI